MSEAALQGRIVVVTGGFGALGRAVATAAEAQGATVVRVDLAPEPAGAGPLDLVGVDIADPAAAACTVRTVVDRCGGLDVLVNIAGGFVWTPLQEAEPEVWARMYRMNLETAVSMTRCALPELLKRPGARVINVGANAAIKAGAGMGPYTASKSAVGRLTESLSEELKSFDITVNAVLPSIIDTPTNRKDMPDADSTEWVKPQSLAEVILFLASPAARGISGALLPVTRGG